MTATESSLPLLDGGPELLVPAGWRAVQVGGADDSGADGVPTGPVAGGVLELGAPGFASNVLLYAGHGGIDVDARDFGPGQVWHDSRSDGPLLRLVVRFGETAAFAVTTVYVWTSVADRPVMGIATWASDRSQEQWPVIERVLRSIVDGEDVWEGWV